MNCQSGGVFEAEDDLQNFNFYISIFGKRAPRGFWGAAIKMTVVSSWTRCRCKRSPLHMWNPFVFDTLPGRKLLIMIPTRFRQSFLHHTHVKLKCNKADLPLQVDAFVDICNCRWHILAGESSGLADTFVTCHSGYSLQLLQLDKQTYFRSRESGGAIVERIKLQIFC